MEKDLWGLGFQILYSLLFLFWSWKWRALCYFAKGDCCSFVRVSFPTPSLLYSLDYKVLQGGWNWIIWLGISNEQEIRLFLWTDFMGIKSVHQLLQTLNSDKLDIFSFLSSNIRQNLGCIHWTLSSFFRQFTFYMTLQLCLWLFVSITYSGASFILYLVSSCVLVAFCNCPSFMIHIDTLGLWGGEELHLFYSRMKRRKNRWFWTGYK